MSSWWKYCIASLNFMKPVLRTIVSKAVVPLRRPQGRFAEPIKALRRSLKSNVRINGPIYHTYQIPKENRRTRCFWAIRTVTIGFNPDIEWIPWLAT